MDEKLVKWFIRVKENKGLVLDFLFIGLIVGSFSQAYADTAGVDKWLQENADKPNMISFGGHLYRLTSVNATPLSDLVFDANFTFVNSSLCGGGR